MADGDLQRDDRPWTRGPVSLLAAGFAHLLATGLQILLMAVLAGFLTTQSSPPTPLTYAMIGLCVLLPAVVSVAVGLTLLLAARRLRDQGPDPLVLLAVAVGVFWPVGRMALAFLTCSILDLPTQMLPAIATLVAAGLIASDTAVSRPGGSPSLR